MSNNHTQSTSNNLGGDVFLVSHLRDFPTNACTFSLWTKKPARLFYGDYDTGSTYDDVLSFFDLDIQSSSIYLNFATDSLSFSRPPAHAMDVNTAHHIAITMRSIASGYEISCYINAVLIDTKTINLMNGNNQVMKLLQFGSLYIGNSAPDTSQDGQFGDLQEARGALSELHIYSNCLSPGAIYLDALGKVPSNVTAYMNMPLDDFHYDRKLGLWIDTVQASNNARDMVRADNNPTIIFKPSFTDFPVKSRSIAFWIRCSASTSGTLLSYGDASNSDHPNDGGDTWILSDPSSLRLGSYSSGLQLGTGEWNHVVVVEDFQSNTTTFYLNGQVSDTPPANYVIDGVITQQPLVIGAQRATDDIDSIFTGDLIELYIWSRALSPSEVADLASGLIPNNDTANSKLVYYDTLGAKHPPETLDPPSNIFLPSFSDAGTYPLLSREVSMQALCVGPNKGGMQTSVYNNLTGREFSLEFWAQINTDGTIIHGLGVNNQTNISAARSGSNIVIVVNNGNTAQMQQHTISVDANTLAQWHHIAISISNTAIVGYLDGQEAFTSPIADPTKVPMLGNQLKLQFGSFDNQVSPMDGCLSEIRLWQRALAVGEVRQRMHHSLVGNEFGLVGRWAFENGLGRDSSSSQCDALPIGKPEFSALVGIDLEPIGSPYLVAQVSLIEDYEFTADNITPRNSYRINVSAYDEKDRPLKGTPLLVSIQAEPNQPGLQASVLVEDSGSTVEHGIGIDQPYQITTNALGIASFALPAADLMAPVLRIRASFMEKDHALLIFPDRQAHHKLSQVTEQDLLTKKVVMEEGAQPIPMVSNEHKDSAPHVAKAIKHFMSVATEKTPQSNSPVVRPIENRLQKEVTPPKMRRYENATASPDAYNSSNDVIAGYSVDANQSSISRSLTVNHLPDWQFVQSPDGRIVVNETPSAQRTRNLAEDDNVTYADTFTRLLLTSIEGRRRSNTPASYNDLIHAIDTGNRERSWFDIFSAIKNAVSFVVQTVEHVYESVKEAIRVAVVYVTDAANQVVAFAIHTVEHAIEAVKGVLAKVGATVMGAINFIKELFDWSDILETQLVIEQILKSSMTTSRDNLSRHKTDTLTWVNGLQSTTRDWLDSLKSGATTHKSAIKNGGPPGSRSNVKGSYVQNLVGTHGKDATMDDDTGGPDPSASHSQLSTIHSNNADKVRHVNNALANLQLFSGDDFSMTVIMDRIVDLMETIATSVFELMKAGIEWFFDLLDKLLADLDQLLAYRINLPLVTRLYEEVITNNGSTLNLYNLLALLGAIPTTVTYKLATGSDHGPYHGQEASSYSNIFSRDRVHTQNARSLDNIPVLNNPPETPSPLTPQEIQQQQASLGLGGSFLALTAISGVFNTSMSILKDPPGVGLKRIGFAINGVFQLTQFPLGSTFALQNNPDAPPAAPALEETIWVAQFFPLVLEFVSATDKLSARKKGFEKFSDIATSVFGGVHAALFLSVFVVEMKDAESDKIDSGLKFAANLSSCVPELAAVVPSPIIKPLMIGVGFTAWELVSLIRYVNEVNAHHTFLPR